METQMAVDEAFRMPPIQVWGDGLVAARCGDEGAVVGEHGQQRHAHVSKPIVASLDEGDRLNAVLLVAEVNQLWATRDNRTCGF